MLRRTVVLIFVQGLTVSISLAAAIYVRLRLLSTGFDVDLFTAALPILLPIKLAAFAMSGSYRRWWYYSHSLDLFRMYGVNVVATCAAAAGIWLWAGPQFPRAIYLLDLALCFMLCVLVRYADQLAIGPRAPAVNRNETIQNGHPYPLWIPNLLLALAASLSLLSIVLVGAVYHFATRLPQLNDLSATDRQTLVQQASQIAPTGFQPFPAAGPLLFYRLVPETHYDRMMNDSFTTNDLGFRTVPTAKPQGVKRIVVVGDSWTFGQGVHYDETFPYQLEKMLNRNNNTWQVYDLAMPGWNTANEIAALRTFFSQLKPDIVVFCPTSNDIDDSLDVWNGHLVTNGFVSQAGFRHSYFYETRWIKVFGALQHEVDRLKERGVPSFVYFLAEWRKLTPYYAKLSGFNAPYTVVPTKYIEKPYRLSTAIDPGAHATPEGNQLIAAYLYNALLNMRLTTGVEPLPPNDPVSFPGSTFNQHEVEAEFRSRSVDGSDLIPLSEDLMGKQALFSVAAPATSRTVIVELALIDNPGLYPLTVNIGLESPEQFSLTKTFSQFSPEPQSIELTKPVSLDKYSFIDVRVSADHVFANGSTPVSMKRPKIRVAN